MNQGRKGRRLMGEINVVPYIDVMLVLLIIFMVTAPLLTQGIKVDLPKASAEPLPPELNERPPVVLSVDREGRYYVDIGEGQAEAADDDAVIAQVSEVLQKEPKTAVLVKADAAVPYGNVVTGMVLLQKAGAEKVGFMTDPLETQSGKKDKPRRNTKP
jgi:biopolymer transport protein TolR